LEGIWKFQTGNVQLRITLLGVACGNLEIKRTSFDKMPMHHDPDTAVVLGRNDTDKENAGFGGHG